MGKLKVLIPSLNRASQLRLLLESLRENFADFNNLDITVLWRAYDEDFEQYINYSDGYDHLMRDYTFKSKSNLFKGVDNISFIEEGRLNLQTFEQNVKEFLYNNIDDHVLLFTDDCVF